MERYIFLWKSGSFDTLPNFVLEATKWPLLSTFSEFVTVVNEKKCKEEADSKWVICVVLWLVTSKEKGADVRQSVKGKREKEKRPTEKREKASGGGNLKGTKHDKWQVTLCT